MRVALPSSQPNMAVGSISIDRISALFEQTVVRVVQQLHSGCDHEHNQSTHICMNETKNSDFWRTHVYYSCSGAKKSLGLSDGVKTPLVACVFPLVKLRTWFWLDVNWYTCFWHLPQKQSRNRRRSSFT